MLKWPIDFIKIFTFLTISKFNSRETKNSDFTKRLKDYIINK